MPDKKLVEVIVKKAKLTDYQMGTTKLFLRSGGMALLDKIRTELLSAAATTIQKYVRRNQQMKAYTRLRKAVVVLQVRMWWSVPGIKDAIP